jgi:hypothetical protein
LRLIEASTGTATTRSSAGSATAPRAPWGSSDRVDGGAGVAYDIYADGAGQIVAVEDVIATVNTS